ncbi:unnamed protein product, partial [marine sediment metagenome]
KVRACLLNELVGDDGESSLMGASPDPDGGPDRRLRE